MTSTQDRFMLQLSQLADEHGFDLAVERDEGFIAPKGKWEPMLSFQFVFGREQATIGGLPQTIGNPSGLSQGCQIGRLQRIGRGVELVRPAHDRSQVVLTRCVLMAVISGLWALRKGEETARLSRRHPPRHLPGKVSQYCLVVASTVRRDDPRGSRGTYHRERRGPPRRDAPADLRQDGRGWNGFIKDLLLLDAGLDVDLVAVRHPPLLDRSRFQHDSGRGVRAHVGRVPSKEPSVHLDLPGFIPGRRSPARSRLRHRSESRRAWRRCPGRSGRLHLRGLAFVWPTGHLRGEWVDLSFVDSRFARALDRWYGGR